jgi:hypothetical protein
MNTVFARANKFHALDRAATAIGRGTTKQAEESNHLRTNSEAEETVK